MSSPLTVRDLYDAVGRRLDLQWLAGESPGDRVFAASRTSQGISLLVPMNLIHPNQIQVLGATEMQYLAQLHEPPPAAAYAQLFHLGAYDAGDEFASRQKRAAGQSTS